MANDKNITEDNLYLTSVLEIARTKLLDTTRRNRLLNFKESVRDIAIIDEMPNQVYEHLILNGGEFKFLPNVVRETSKREPIVLERNGDHEPDRTLPKSDDETTNVPERYKDNRLQTPFTKRDLDRKLRTLYYAHRTLIEESGANNLYLIIGYLEWSENREEDTHSRSPLMLVPVRLNKINAGEVQYKLKFDDEALDTNYSLYEKLKANFDINLPLIEDEQLPEVYWEKVIEAISTRRNDGWNVIREMTLGLFRFNKQIMWHDLNPKRWPAHSQLLDKRVVRRILLGSGEGDTAPGQYTKEYNQDEGEQKNELPKLSLILDADSSQYSALIDAIKLNDGLVIEGPPGTGKSQTIANLIAIALEMGLSVLFVAEKMAALNVVIKRLEETGLDKFCLQLHGLKTSKKELLNSLDVRLQLNVDTPTNLKLREDELESTKIELINFSKIISETVGPEAIPLYSLPWLVEKLKQQLPNDYIGINIDNPDGITSKSYLNAKYLLESLGKEWNTIPVEARKYWLGYLPDKYKESQSDKLVDLLNSVTSAIKTMNDWLGIHNVPEFAPNLYQIKYLLKLSKLNPTECLPTLPPTIQIHLVYQIIHNDLFDRYSNILAELVDYLDVVRIVNDVFDYASVKSLEYADTLEAHSSTLNEVCCSSDLLLSDLPTEYDSLREVIASLDSLPRISQPIVEISKSILRTIADYKELIVTAERLLNGPAELSLHSHKFHLKPTINNYLSAAMANNNELTVKLSDLKQFTIDSNVNAQKVQDSYQAIRAQQGSWFPIFNKEYRQGKNFIRRLMKNPGQYTRKGYFLDNIHGLLEYCSERDKFQNNNDFKLAFGTLFCGIDTDWTVLKNIIDFAQLLREEFGRENAIKIISDWDTHCESVLSAKDSISCTLSLLEKYSDSHPFPKGLWQRPISEVSRTLKPWEGKLSHAINELLQPWCNSNITLGESLDVVKAYKLGNIKEQSIEKHKDFNVLLGEYWDKSLTNLVNLQKQEKWFKGRLDNDSIDKELLKFIVPDAKSFRKELFTELIYQAKELYKATSNQINIFNKIGHTNIADWLGGDVCTLDDFSNKINGAISTITYLPLMVRWRIIDKQVSELGLNEISKSITSGILNGEHACTAFEYSFNSCLLEGKIIDTPSLNSFSESNYENLRDRFAEFDKNILKLNAQKIASKLCKSNIPEGVGYGRVSNYTEKRLIVHETGKKSRHIPIRQLIRRTSNAIQALKPCFLMSPLSVSQYLAPGELEFDLVVMDEASQIRPEDALSAIARSNKCIIVGDPKQLPPTSFFDTAKIADENDEETIIDDTESILDVCLKQFPFRRLRWHYRSQHEALIQFSNEQFYENDLIVFPSPKGDARDLGVHYTYIDNPSYKTGKNVTEAELIVENIIHHYHRYKNRSLGVAAFNKRQAEEIQLILDKRRQKDPTINALIAAHDDVEALFIKNLENVQGDERDVIFISTTYGPEKPGAAVFQRFGPINSDLGWRRLNVIATRARQRVEVFTSLRPTDIVIGPNSSRGVRTFRDYLEYVSEGRVREHGVKTYREPDSDFEIAVSKIIEELGFECEPQVGVAGFFIDIGVIHPDRPGEYLFGVECDGASYHSAISVRDRDRLRQEILESKGWYIHRIWSTNWFQSRSIEIDKLSRILKIKLEEDRFVVGKVSEASDKKEIIGQTQHATDNEIKYEEDVLTDSLEEALNRFWETNLSPYFSNRKKSILSEQMIHYLVKARPISEDDWFNSIPMEVRQYMNPEEKEYLIDILDVIMEYY